MLLLIDSCTHRRLLKKDLIDYLELQDFLCELLEAGNIRHSKNQTLGRLNLSGMTIHLGIKFKTNSRKGVNRRLILVQAKILHLHIKD